VELHGGSVRLESAVGHGTTVTCVFPLDHTAERTAA
jgi:signal transduction histidine kinase